MAKKQKPQTEVVEQLVLVHDPILGSKYELQSVEVYIDETNESTENAEL